MKTAIVRFEFLGDQHTITIPLKDIDTFYYGEFWTYWDSFKQDIIGELDGEMVMVKVGFDCEITADCDNTQSDRIGFENAYINIYQKDSDKLLAIIPLTTYDIELC